MHLKGRTWPLILLGYVIPLSAACIGLVYVHMAFLAVILLVIEVCMVSLVTFIKHRPPVKQTSQDPTLPRLMRSSTPTGGAGKVAIGMAATMIVLVIVASLAAGHN